MTHKEFLSKPAEAKLRAAFAAAPQDAIGTSALVMRLMQPDIGASSHMAAYALIYTARNSGLLLCTGTKRNYRYAINTGWSRQPAHATKPDENARRDLGPALAYDGPAFASGPLAPVIGAGWDDELPPCEGARIVDALHRQFQHAFGALE